MIPEEQGRYDAEKGLKEPVVFSGWCLENGRKYIGAKNFDEFKKNAEDYTRYRDAFFAAKQKKASV